jgi:hypothetical protein
MKKKIISLLVCVLTFLMFTAMSAFADTAKTEYGFTYGDHRYLIGMSAADAFQTLGTADSSRDVNNCANGYVNKAYTFGGKAFEVYIEQEGKKEVVANITLLSNQAATEEGLKVGDTAEQVTKIYADAKKGLGSYTTTLGTTKLYIKMKGDTVSYITYMQDGK